jgi:hypothetical protein
VGRCLWRQDGSVVCNCCWPSSTQSFSGPIPMGLATIFYSLRFESSLSCLLRLAGLRWTYSTPPLHGISSLRINYMPLHDPVRTADRTPCLTIPLLFCISVSTVICCCGSNVYLATVQQQTCIRWQRNTRNMFSQPLPSNGHLLWLYYSGFQATCHNMFKRRDGCMCFSICTSDLKMFHIPVLFQTHTH